MTFISIVRKNFVHNFNKYISFYFVNSLIVAMLFMYGSLMYNQSIIDSAGQNTLSETIKIALFGLVVFSIIFITYTNTSFLKNRGKEFGMYLTLGVTTKDLSRLILLENLGIMVASIITGIIGGSVFARLFYMGLNRVLDTMNVIFRFEYKSFLLSIGVVTIIFIINMIFNMVYIRRISIINIIRSSKNKEAGKGNLLLGAIALILLILALCLLPKTLLNEIFKNSRYMVGVFLAITILAPYLIIGSLLALIKKIVNRIPKLYNNNILLLSNLSHRLLAYKNIIYMVSLLMAGVMFFLGFTYSAYVSSREVIESSNPYDFMFVESNKYNKVNKSEIENLLKDYKLEKYNTLEYLRAVELGKGEDSQLSYRSNYKMIISEANFNKVSEEYLTLNKGQATFITAYEEAMEYNYPNVVLAPFSDRDILEIEESFDEDLIINSETYNELVNLDNINVLQGVKFVNSINYSYSNALVVSNEDYDLFKNQLPKDKIEIAHLINSENSEGAFNQLESYLKDKNGLDSSYWNSSSGILYGKYPQGERGEIEKKMPISTEGLVKMSRESNGMNFFTMMFIGALFSIAIGVILYYKVLSDIEEESERISALRRIGTTDAELKTTISKELGVTFFMPIMIGVGLGYYYLYLMFSNSDMKNIILKNSAVVAILGIIVQVIFYLLSRRKYIKEII